MIPAISPAMAYDPKSIPIAKGIMMQMNMGQNKLASEDLVTAAVHLS
jgi:hypothetical protein